MTLPRAVVFDSERIEPDASRDGQPIKVEGFCLHSRARATTKVPDVTRVSQELVDIKERK
jgi:hypothetical protein